MWGTKVAHFFESAKHFQHKKSALNHRTDNLRNLLLHSSKATKKTSNLP